MFNLDSDNRLEAWKEFRENLELSDDPFTDTLNLWKQAPYVSDYLDPYNPETWPDAWHLVIDNRLDRLGIILGMYYTLKLTRRLMDSNFEIHKAYSREKNSQEFFLVVDNNITMKTYGDVIYEAPQIPNKIWSDPDQNKY